MADQFQSYDKNPIVGNTITIRAWRFGFRELILAAIAVLLLVMCLILGGLLGNSSVELQEARTSAQVANKMCKDTSCLKTTAHIMELINVSVDPCDNFFQFACGGFQVKNPIDEYTVTQSILRQMYQINQDRLLSILESPTDRFTTWSAERKLKDFFTSCTDDFRREQIKAGPLFDKVFPLLGGWYVLDPSWDASSWTLNGPLKAVQTDLWVDALFAPRPRMDQFDTKKRIITIYPGGSGRYMRWSDYTTTPTDKQKKLQEDYRKFMRTVAQLVARDGGVANNQDLTTRINVFVQDAYTVESDIAGFATNARYHRDAFSEAEKVTLDELKRQTGNEIDWTDQMSYLFNEAGVTGSTKVVVPYPTYLTNLTAMIRGLEPSTRNRMLHNYLTWRVMEIYVFQLSWEYVHSNRQFYVDKYGRPNFLGIPKYCFYLTQWHMKTALGVLYVNSHFDEKNKVKVTEITESVKTALETMLTKNTWMDKATKDYAIDKMKSSTYKIGYPDFMKDEAKVDGIYAQLNINVTDFFGNLLELNEQDRREWNRKVREGEDRSQWYFSTFATNLAVYWYWDEIIVPAGILQFPMYTHSMPHYYSFGAIGTILGHFIHHLIGEKGRRWDKGGDFIKAKNGWWSNQTVQNYNKATKCVADLYNNVTQGPYISYNGDQTTIDVDGEEFAWEAMSITTGIRLAYNAYQKWQQIHGQDFFHPGLQFSPQQLFFMAHAQLFCYNRDPAYDYLITSQYRIGNANEETRINVAMQELPEFKQAFSCRASDKMVSTKPCTYY